MFPKATTKSFSYSNTTLYILVVNILPSAKSQYNT